MKRFLCPKHIHYLKIEGKSVLLDSIKCSICRYENRQISLKDIAKALEEHTKDFRFVYDNPSYDPHGITIIQPFAKTVNKFLKSIHYGYRKGFIEEVTNGNKLDE